ncbi:MAG: flagellar motor protein MotB [Acetobacteraceae bacterium]|nr:flagellar motor protein MotB [Acetobacteraceae bacterium]
MSGRKRDKGTIIVRRSEVVERGHHSGAWKVAYADFVTALMAFFLLMWLLNATTQEQKRGLADYFSPTNHLAITTSGSGAPFGGRTPNSDGTLISDRGAVELTRTQPYPVVDDDDTGDAPTQQEPSKVPGTVTLPSASQGGASAGRLPREASPPPAVDKPSDTERQEKREFEHAAGQIREALASDPTLAGLGSQVAIDTTPEGMRIQLLDADRTPMFATGSSLLNDRARAVLAKIAPVLVKMPESLTIAGHTDAAPYRGTDKTNWDLSAERANSTRRLLVEAGIPETRLRSVTGNADRDPLIASDPLAAANRRIAIVLLRDHAAPKR